MQKRDYELTDDIREVLISQADLAVEAVQAKNEQKQVNDLSDEISIFTKGSAYWESMITRGISQQVLNPVESQMLSNAVNYCNGIYSQLTKHQLKEIARIVALLKENGIE